MFSYYGSKSKIAKFYPKPEYGLIVEPFAGAAWYSVMHRGKEVILNDTNPTIVRIWDYIINKADPGFIRNNSDFRLGEDIRNKGFEAAYEELVGFCINRGTAHPCHIVQQWSCQVLTNPRWASTTAYALRRIADMVNEVKHWIITNDHFRNMPDIEATWFIDPPYQAGGIYYNQPKINYQELAEFCKTRRGQVIVCENSDADWLPFNPLTITHGQKKKTIESVWTN